jgi:hypothetical protein
MKDVLIKKHNKRTWLVQKKQKEKTLRIPVMHIEEEKSRILKDEEEQQEHQKKDPSFILKFKVRKI